jgi:hypothetical protein
MMLKMRREIVSEIWHDCFLQSISNDVFDDDITRQDDKCSSVVSHFTFEGTTISLGNIFNKSPVHCCVQLDTFFRKLQIINCGLGRPTTMARGLPLSGLHLFPPSIGSGQRGPGTSGWDWLYILGGSKICKTNHCLRLNNFPPDVKSHMTKLNLLS